MPSNRRLCQNVDSVEPERYSLIRGLALVAEMLGLESCPLIDRQLQVPRSSPFIAICGSIAWTHRCNFQDESVALYIVVVRAYASLYLNNKAGTEGKICESSRCHTTQSIVLQGLIDSNSPYVQNTPKYSFNDFS